MAGHVMVTLILEVLFRAFTYGVHATFITLLFPSDNFGFLYGVSFLIGGLTGFLAIPLFDMSMGTLSGTNSKPLVNPDANTTKVTGVCMFGLERPGVKPLNLSVQIPIRGSQ